MVRQLLSSKQAFAVHESLCFLPATKVAELIRAGEISASEVVDAAIEQADRVDPLIHGFIGRTDELARAEAIAVDVAVLRGEAAELGPLAGVPGSVKDLTVTAGVTTTFGVEEYRNNVPAEDAPAFGRVRRAGAALLGKNSTPAFGWLGTTENELVGVTNNPWALDRSVGGSSGGCAALVASGVGQWAMGSDGGGSVRVPAALCGVVGMKPSQGRVPRGTEVLKFDTVDVIGPFARTVADVALLMSVMSGPLEDEPYMLPETGVDYWSDLRAEAVEGLRIAYSPNLGHGPVDPEVAEIVAQAVVHFASALKARVTQVDVKIPDPIEYFGQYNAPAVSRYIGAEPGVGRLLGRYPGLLEIFAGRAEIDAGSWWDMIMPSRQKMFESIAGLFSSHDLLITPTTPVAAWPHNGEKGPEMIDGCKVEWPAIDFFRFTETFSHTGHPALTINCGFTALGLPVGLQIVGRQRDDRGVLRAAAAYEGTTQWHMQKPPIV